VFDYEYKVLYLRLPIYCVKLLHAIILWYAMHLLHAIHVFYTMQLCNTFIAYDIVIVCNTFIYRHEECIHSKQHVHLVCCSLPRLLPSLDLRWKC